MGTDEGAWERNAADYRFNSGVSAQSIFCPGLNDALEAEWSRKIDETNGSIGETIKRYYMRGTRGFARRAAHEGLEAESTRLPRGA